MCDIVVKVASDRVVFAKNSDREPGEAQWVEFHARDNEDAMPDLLAQMSHEPKHAVLISRPAWLWGCEMGINERGVAIGNEAVFTKMRIGSDGVTGMDMQRWVLARADDTEHAVELLTGLIETVPQGGRMGHRHRGFRYHSSFMVADARGAWAVESAGNFWAKKRITGCYSMSNALQLEADADAVHPDAFAHAKSRGWARSAGDFSFHRAFGRPAMGYLSGAAVRAACTLAEAQRGASTTAKTLSNALCSHGGLHPLRGWRMKAPCAHASGWATKSGGQTTQSMIAELETGQTQVWMTGTSSPCLSVFKHAPFDANLFPPRQVADTRFDPSTLWWRHEQLHRQSLVDYDASRARLAKPLDDLRSRCWSRSLSDTDAWAEHATSIASWATQSAVPAGFWRKLSKLDGIPARAPSQWVSSVAERF